MINIYEVESGVNPSGGINRHYILVGRFRNNENQLIPFFQKIRIAQNSLPPSFKEENITKSNSLSVSILWTRYFDDGSSSFKSIYADLDFESEILVSASGSRNVPNGLGDYDVLHAITDLEVNTCITEDLNFSLSDYPLTPFSFVPTIANDTLPST